MLLVATATQRFWVAPLVARSLAQSSGRHVAFDSITVGLTAALEPVVRLRGVRIDNATWAASARPLADLREAVAVMSWRSVAEHRPVVARMVLSDGEVALERLADGRRNWRLRRPDDTGPGRYKILSLQPQRAKVQFIHHGIDLSFDATSRDRSTSEGDAATRPTQLAFAGSWHGVPFTVDVATGRTLTFLETGEQFPLRGDLQAGGARLDVDGRAGDILRAPTIAAHVALAGDRLAPFAAFIGERHGEANKAFRIEGQLDAAPHAYALTQAHARVGTTDLAGEVRYTRVNERSAWFARLHSDSTEAADLEWLGRSRPALPHPASGAAAPAPLGLARLRTADADIAFDAGRIHVAEAAVLKSLKFHGVLEHGRLDVSALDLGLAGGHVDGQATIDATAEPARARTALAMQGVRLEALLPAQTERKRLTGTLHGHAALTATGDSAAALLGSAAGTLDVSLAGGTIASLLDAELGLEAGQMLKSFIGGSSALPVRCAALALDVHAGTARVKSLVFESERTRLTGTGRIDLGAETLDLVLTPEAKQGGLFNLARSIRLQGPLKKPKRALIERATPAPAAAACPR